MLRRTRAEQVAPVFTRFMARFPDARSLSGATEGKVEDIVRPLGLAWRVPAFRLMARALVERHGGNVPADRDQLLALPGVGDYVAAAVLALAFDLPAMLVDTNTVRVAGRYYGFHYHAESRRNRQVRDQVARLFDPTQPRTSARAVLDFASMVCRARLPLCGACPVLEHCAAHRSVEVPHKCVA